jgi:ferritin-like protein
MGKKLITLAKELEFETTDQYYYYILETKINGQSQQVRKLFNEMKKDDKLHFLNYYLDPSDYGTEICEEVRKICIEELLK